MQKGNLLHISMTLSFDGLATAKAWGSSTHTACTADFECYYASLLIFALTRANSDFSQPPLRVVAVARLTRMHNYTLFVQSLLHSNRLCTALKNRANGITAEISRFF